MEALRISEIMEATNGQLLSGKADVLITDIVTDSRVEAKGMFFIPLKGSQFDGHDFIDQAFRNGAVGCIVDREIMDYDTDKCIIRVDNTLTALHDIARYYRKKFHVPFIAITGSVGKTTTKDMTACVLEQKYSVLKTKGNFNNEIGLPLTVFRLNSEHEIGITEMGMSGFGEISRLVSIIEPQIAIITNIGLAHIEKLGSRQNILKAKMEIFERFARNNLAILNGDDPLLYALKGSLPFRTMYFAIYNDECELKAEDIMCFGEEGCRFNVIFRGSSFEVRLPVMGEHNIYNALAAIAVGIEHNLDKSFIQKGILSFKPDRMRMDIFQAGELKVINDCYNASPASMKVAIDILAQLHAQGRKIAILGDMLEMGNWAFSAHREVGSYVAKNSIEYLITVGINGEHIALGAIEAGMSFESVFSFNSNTEVVEFLKQLVKAGDVILVKGSRGMSMEEISDYLQYRRGEEG